MRTRRRATISPYIIVAVLTLVGASPHAWAKGKSGRSRKPAAARAEAAEASDPAQPPQPPAEAGDAPSEGKAGKPKVYNFSGLDLEGRLKTPQLLYFLNRVRVELDSTNNAKRSFMKDLERSADDKGL